MVGDKNITYEQIARQPADLFLTYIDGRSAGDAVCFSINGNEIQFLSKLRLPVGVAFALITDSKDYFLPKISAYIELEASNSANSEWFLYTATIKTIKAI